MLSGKISADDYAFAFVCKIPYDEILCTPCDKTDEKKAERLFAHRLLEHVVRELGLIKSDCKITANDYGAPSIPGAYLSLSHTFRYAFAAVSSKPIGCDAEFQQDGKDFGKLLQRIMTESEKSLYKSIIDKNDGLITDKKDLFYTLWTAKEAAFKRKGVPPFEPSKTKVKGVKVFLEGNCAFAVDSVSPLSVYFLSFENEKFVTKSALPVREFCRLSE